MRKSPRVHYGGTPITPPTEVCLGGGVKFQRLQPFFPDAGEQADVLYLVSSCLPARWLTTYWKARRNQRRVIWNQSAVSYPAVWPDLPWDEDNLLLEQGLHAADYVIYQSHFAREVADRFLGPFPGPWEVVYNAVDTQIFAPSGIAKRAGVFTIRLAGTQYRWTSVDIALSALAALRRRCPGARLLITGRLCWVPDSSAADRIARARAESLGVTDAVEFVGEYTQTEAPAIYARADVLIHTRYDDLCPNVVIEAMACGVPVVYSRTGGTPELVGDEAGIGVDTGHSWDREPVADPDDWATALECIALDRARYAEAARQSAIDRFELAPWIARHAAIFERVSSSPPLETPPRVPVSERLRSTLQLKDLLPSRVQQGDRFNTQPDGRSAFAVAAANATHATLVLLDDEVQDTFFSSPSWLSAAVPADLTRASGTHGVRLAELLRTSNEVEFVIERRE